MNTETGESAAILSTPRRSTRKSIRPLQDYAEIIEKKVTRSIKKNYVIENISEEEEQTQPRWTPSQVGKSSQKRGKRKTVGAQKRRKIELGENSSVDKENENEGLAPLETEPEQEAGVTEKKQEVSDTKAPSDATKMQIDHNTVLISNQKICSEYIAKNATDEQRDKEAKPKIVTDLVPIGSNNEEDIVPIAGVEQKERNLPSLDGFVKEEQPKIASKNDQDIVHNAGAENQEQTAPSFSVFNDRKEESTIAAELIPIGSKNNNVFPEGDADILDGEEEMPSLIFCDDDEVEEPNTAGKSLNVTFDGSDNTKILAPKNSIFVAPSEEEMPSLMLHEEEEPEKATNTLNETFNASDCVEIIPVAIPEIKVQEPSPMVGNALNDTFNASDCIEVIPAVGNSLNDIFNASDCIEVLLPVEPTSNKNAFKKTLKPGMKVTIAASPVMTPQDRRKIVRVATPYGSKENHQTNPDTLNEQIDIIETVRSARKRSKSLCEETEPVRKVKFHSPSNTTAVIEDFDISIAQNVAKEKKRNDDNVTKRRKRSISLDETRKPRLTQTPQKVVTRTKLPNFAAIHKKHFNLMENLEDHMTRKAERARLLANSAGKVQSASAAKLSKPNVASKTSSHLPVARRALKPALDSTQLQAPDLRFDQKLKAQSKNKKPLTFPTNAPPTMDNKPSTTSLATLQKTPKKTFNASAYLNSLRECKGPKPFFNLSTAVPTQPTSSLFLAAASPLVPKATKTEDKLGARRQRHVNLFKARGDTTARATQAREAIRGVRSNRRFDLQMQHRRNLQNQ